MGKRKKNKRAEVKPRTVIVEKVVHLRRQNMTELEERILVNLRVMDVPSAAKLMEMSESTLGVHLYRIRRKYKDARNFVNKIDALRQANPSLRPYLKTRETE